MEMCPDCGKTMHLVDVILKFTYTEGIENKPYLIKTYMCVCGGIK